MGNEAPTRAADSAPDGDPSAVESLKDARRQAAEFEASQRSSVAGSLAVLTLLPLFFYPVGPLREIYVLVLVRTALSNIAKVEFDTEFAADINRKHAGKQVTSHMQMTKADDGFNAVESEPMFVGFENQGRNDKEKSALQKLKKRLGFHPKSSSLVIVEEAPQYTILRFQASLCNNIVRGIFNVKVRVNGKCHDIIKGQRTKPKPNGRLWFRAQDIDNHDGGPDEMARFVTYYFNNAPADKRNICSFKNYQPSKDCGWEAAWAKAPALILDKPEVDTVDVAVVATQSAPTAAQAEQAAQEAQAKAVAAQAKAVAAQAAATAAEDVAAVAVQTAKALKAEAQAAEAQAQAAATQAAAPQAALADGAGLGEGAYAQGAVPGKLGKLAPRHQRSSSTTSSTTIRNGASTRLALVPDVLAACRGNRRCSASSSTTLEVGQAANAAEGRAAQSRKRPRNTDEVAQGGGAPPRDCAPPVLLAAPLEGAQLEIAQRPDAWAPQAGSIGSDPCSLDLAVCLSTAPSAPKRLDYGEPVVEPDSSDSGTTSQAESQLILGGFDFEDALYPLADFDFDSDLYNLRPVATNTVVAGNKDEPATVPAHAMDGVSVGTSLDHM